MRFLRLVCAAAAAAAVPSADAADGLDDAHWIWASDGRVDAGGYVLLRNIFFIPGEPAGGSLVVTVDDAYELYLNGTMAGKGDGWTDAERFDIGAYLRPGKNIVGLRAENAEGPAGAALALEWQSRDRQSGRVATGPSWKSERTDRWKWNWETVDYDDSSWGAVTDLGAVGSVEPWGSQVTIPAASAAAAPQAPKGMRDLADFTFEEGDMVVFLGPTLVERAQHYGFLETALGGAFAESRLRFRNLGWSADDVRGSSRGRFGFQPEGFRHLEHHVSALEPDVIFVSYGANESFEGKAGLADFRSGLDTLLAALEKTGARIVLVSPIKQEALGGKLPDPTQHNRDLALYVDALRDTAERRGHWFIDLFSNVPVRESADSDQPALTSNSIHLTPAGYRAVAEIITRMLGRQPPNWEAAEPVRQRVVRKNELYFHRWRPQNETYLTLFRKHEQGNNYREIPMFDPLVAELEKEIHALAESLAESPNP